MRITSVSVLLVGVPLALWLVFHSAARFPALFVTPLVPIQGVQKATASAQNTPPIANTDLTMFRGNPARNLSGTGTVPRRPKLLWRFCTRTKLEGAYEKRGDPKLTAGSTWRGMGWTGQPVRVGDRIYFGSSDSNIYCLDAVTGKVVWYYPTHHCVKGSISVFGDRIYHGGRDNKIHCYDLQGRMVWETRTGNDMDSNPVVIDGRGYVGGEDKHLYSFDAATGKILWKSELTNGSIESSPCVVDNRVIAGSAFGTLLCCDAATGKTLWKFRTRGDTDSTVAAWDGRLYVGCAAKPPKEKIKDWHNLGETGHLWCVDQARGKPLWHVAMARGIWATVALNPEMGRLYVGCNNGILYAMRMADGRVVWKRKLGNRIWGSAVVVDGCVLVGVRNGRLWCLDEKTGKPLWMFDDGFDIDATPCVAGGMVVIGSQNGWVYGIGEAAAGEQVNPHWFATTFPLRRRPDHNPAGIVTIKNPAPTPATYTDTSGQYRRGLYTPVYGKAYQPVKRVGE